MAVDDRMEESFDRRQFMRAATWAIGVLIGAGYSLPAILYILGPALQQESEENWIALGPASKVEMGVPTLFKFHIERKSGWITDEEEVSVYVRTDDRRQYVGLSNICTHLGCRVRWIADRQQFFCPCHNGVYDKDGNVISGPPPRPLDHYEIRLDGDELEVRGG